MNLGYLITKFVCNTLLDAARTLADGHEIVYTVDRARMMNDEDALTKMLALCNLALAIIIGDKTTTLVGFVHAYSR